MVRLQASWQGPQPARKETEMNTMNATPGSPIRTGLRALACGVGALAITTVLSWSLVDSTAAAPSTFRATHHTRMVKLTIQPRHVWFGQSRPAVLVD
jgi:hypothetical protein